MALPYTQILASLPSSPNIIGQDINIIATGEIKALVEQELEQFEIKYFTARERSATESGAQRIQYLAGRFCAKKAVLKSLNIASPHTFWLDIEVQRLPTGEPSVVLYGNCQKIAAELGIAKWLLSISHVSSYATASAIALGSSADVIALSTNSRVLS